MVIFYSYVSLPEGNFTYIYPKNDPIFVGKYM